MPQAGRQADHRHRGVPGPRLAPRASGTARAGRRLGRRHRGRQQALLPPHPAGRERPGLPQPHPARLPGVHGGLLLQAADGLGAAQPVPRGADRHHRVPRRPRAPGAAARRRQDGHRARRPAAGHLRARQPVRRAAGPRPRRPARHQPAAHRDRQAHRRPADRHQRLALRAPRGPHQPRRAAVRADQRDAQRPEAVQVRGRGALPQVGAGDALAVPRLPRGVRQHPVGGRARRRHHRVRQAAAAQLPRARGPRRRQLPRRAHLGGRPGAMGRRAARHGARPARLRAADHQEHGVRLVLPDRLGPDQARQGRRHPRRPGPRLGRRLRGGLLPADHRPRPDQVRPDLRAVPQPEPHLDARHRHGLRLALPRRDDPLRGREVRPRPRRPDHHVRHDQGAQRGARRRPGARLPLRRRRQDRQGHAAVGDGPRHAAQVLLRGEPEVHRRVQGGQRAAGHVPRRSRRQAGGRRGQGSRRASSAATASTPPRW